MKIRIRGNSIRMRLTKSEVAHFSAEGYLEEKTEFAGSTFVYALKAHAAADNLTADFSGNKITMYVPSAIAREWTETNMVGVENNMTLKSGSSLYILLEKDFKCTDAGVKEDQSDNYDHPTKICAS